MGRQVHALWVAPIVAGMFGLGISPSKVAGQVADGPRPAAAPDSRPAAPAGDNWWDAPAPAAPGRAPAADRRLPERDDRYLFRHDSNSNGMDYPGNEMRDWVFANAMAARSRAMLSRAETELNQAIRRVQSRYERSKDFTEAVAAEKQAYTDYVAIRQKALKGVATDPKYHALSQLRDELGDKIAARRSAHASSMDINPWLISHGFEPSRLSAEQLTTLKALFLAEQQKSATPESSEASPQEILAMATLKLQYASDARAIEVAALSSDESLKSAREKMVAANKRTVELRSRVDDVVRESPEVIIARRNLEDARISVIEATALAQGAGVSSNYALNYSYFLHRNDNGGTYGPNGNYGSYYSPYWGR